MDTMLAGLMGILGGILSALVVSILSQRKNNAEIAHLQAETRRINFELENVQSSETREVLNLLLEHIHQVVGRASALTRVWRESPILSDKSDEEISQYFEGSFLSKYELEQLLKATDKDALYIELETWHEFTETQRAATEYHNFLVKKKIFVDNEELLSACFELDGLLGKLVNVTRLNIKKIAPGNLAKTYSEYGNNVVPLVEKIERLMKLTLKPKSLSN
ncbi:MAG: hypothetical protein L6461_22925 [Anaerolineae bacterium]|nr:hypothetical protein [Anaerolineae bacterium]